MAEAYAGLTRKLVRVAAAFDEETGRHNERVSAVAERVARAYGCTERFIRRIAEFAPLHDIGKVFVDRDLIRKERSLTSGEHEEMKKHTAYASFLFEDPWFAVARNIARFHHERWDGSGYPQGLRGNEIPLEAQIVGVADVYDALRSRRSYKAPLGPEDCLRRMRHGDERMAPDGFNPELMDTLEGVVQDIEQEIYRPLAACCA
jgi:HD-GYP domain-containing protein (c-di-GMP phosphodiesterase class II)